MVIIMDRELRIFTITIPNLNPAKTAKYFASLNARFASSNPALSTLFEIEITICHHNIICMFLGIQQVIYFDPFSAIIDILWKFVNNGHDTCCRGSGNSGFIRQELGGCSSGSTERGCKNNPRNNWNRVDRHDL